jgi:acetyl-CoA decarbonylase/synthase complex subunit delta
MTFSTLAGSVGGGVQTPGFMGVGKAFLGSRKLLSADGGLERLVWMPKELKQLVQEDLAKNARELGCPDLLDKIADETIATDPQAIRKYLEEVGHPALTLPDMGSLWTGEEETPASESAMGASATEGALPSESPTPPVSDKPCEEDSSSASSATTIALPTGNEVLENGAVLAKLKADLKAELKEELIREVAAEIIGTLQDKFLDGRGSALDAPQADSASEIDRSKRGVSSNASDRSAKSKRVEQGPVSPERRKVEAVPARYADEKLAEVTSIRISKDAPIETIEAVTLGATKDDGGTRGHTVTIGGQNCLAFHYFEGEIPRQPVLALEVFDTVSEKISPTLRDVWGGLLERPAEMAKRAVERHGAQMISVRLEGTHPEKGNKSPEEALTLVQDVLAAVDVPLIVTAHGHFASTNQVMKKIAAGCAGERLLLNWVEADNYRTIAGAALAYGHCVVGQTPIDVNLAKQLNILLANMDLPRDRVLMDPLTGALGYGLEYTFSVMERIRLTALGGDKPLASPMIVCVGQEAWKVKEASAPRSKFPEWGEASPRAVQWEVLTAMPLIQAGADLVILYHPESLEAIHRNVAKLSTHARPAS